MTTASYISWIPLKAAKDDGAAWKRAETAKKPPLFIKGKQLNKNCI
jgi:hypothetical protein